MDNNQNIKKIHEALDGGLGQIILNRVADEMGEGFLMDKFCKAIFENNRTTLDLCKTDDNTQTVLVFRFDSELLFTFLIRRVIDDKDGFFINALFSEYFEFLFTEQEEEDNE